MNFEATKNSVSKQSDTYYNTYNTCEYLLNVTDTFIVTNLGADLYFDVPVTNCIAVGIRHCNRSRINVPHMHCAGTVAALCQSFLVTAHYIWVWLIWVLLKTKYSDSQIPGAGFCAFINTKQSQAAKLSEIIASDGCNHLYLMKWRWVLRVVLKSRETDVGVTWRLLFLYSAPPSMSQQHSGWVMSHELMLWRHDVNFCRYYLFCYGHPKKSLRFITARILFSMHYVHSIIVTKNMSQAAAAAIRGSIHNGSWRLPLYVYVLNTY